MIAFLVTAKLHIVGYHLFLWDVFENQEVWMILVIIIAGTGLPALATEEALSTRMCSTHRRIHSPICNRRWTIDWIRTWSWWRDTFTLILKLLQFVQAFTKLPLSFLLLNGAFTYCIHPLPVNKIACARSSSKFTIHSLPMLFEIRLNMFKSIEGRHLTRFLWWLLLAAALAWWLSLWRYLASKSSLWWLKRTSLAWAHGLSILWSILRTMPLLILFRITARMCVVCRVLTIIL